jgi:DNA mismatch repair protein MSH6
MIASSRPLLNLLFVQVGFTKDKFTFWAAKLIALGYKIARVEQKESPTAQAKNARESDSTGKSRVLKRELDRIISPGTIVDEELLAGPTATYLLSIIVRRTPFYFCWSSPLTLAQESESSREFGVCFVDTATGEICLSHLEDDMQLSKLRTLLIQLKPREIVYKKGNLRRDTVVLLKQSLVNPIINMLKQEEWIDSQQLLDKLTFEDYFFDPALVASTEGSWSKLPYTITINNSNRKFL